MAVESNVIAGRSWAESPGARARADPSLRSLRRLGAERNACRAAPFAGMVKILTNDTPVPPTWAGVEELLVEHGTDAIHTDWLDKLWRAYELTKVSGKAQGAHRKERVAYLESCWPHLAARPEPRRAEVLASRQQLTISGEQLGEHPSQAPVAFALPAAAAPVALALPAAVAGAGFAAMPPAAPPPPINAWAGAQQDVLLKPNPYERKLAVLPPQPQPQQRGVPKAKKPRPEVPRDPLQQYLSSQPSVGVSQMASQTRQTWT